MAPLARMNRLVSLRAHLFKEPLDAIAAMRCLQRLKIVGPAKGWAKLRDCTQLEEAVFSDVQMANLKRWDTWRSLGELSLTGRGLKSFAGLEASQNLEVLRLANVNVTDLGPLAELPKLRYLLLRATAGAVDLKSIAAARGLQVLVIDSNVDSDRDIIRLPSLRPLATARSLEDLELTGVCVEDGSLMPLADLDRLRRVRLGRHIGADVDSLRIARPDLVIDYTPPPPRLPELELLVGKVTAHRPGEDFNKWWIFDDLATALATTTNYDAEKRIRASLKKRDRQVASRLEWDTEAGGVGIYADSESDIRVVAEVITALMEGKPSAPAS
ncbi:MAG: hypothetical protein HQM09_16760 [Candidatus Riflebacteria bacterium]|nr:hypothetical protein [Candidatus Riflebacteria bacterium]